jgi:hypothetical protein
MSHHVYMFLLVVCLFLSLARLGRLCWFPLRPSSLRGGVKRSTLQRLLKPRTQTTAPPVVSLPLPRQVEGQHLCLCGPGAR